MQPFTKNNLLIAACYAAVLALGMFLGPKFLKENTNSRNGAFIPFGSGRDTKIERVLQLIKDNYVDDVKIDTLQYTAIEEILARLDPHSHFLPPSEARHLDENLEGHFDGIGIEYFIVNDTLLITSVISNAPASRAGLAPGDKIIKVDKKDIAGTGISSAEAAKLLRGKKGTQVKLKIKPAGKSSIKEIVVKRAQISVSSVDAAYILAEGTGYIKISRFGTSTAADFTAAVNTLKNAGMKRLVLDLRENGGGYLNAAAELADEFLSEQKLIVYTKGIHEPRTDYYATAKGSFESGELAILVDENTASASEIVAGAVQDLDRGVIVGRPTFGKGLVQEQFNFGDGSVLNLTVARYYTPSGRSIQRPYKKGIKAYYHDAYNHFGQGIKSETKQKDSLHSKNKTYKTAAGRLMYGGGGISPDIFVPADTAAYNDFYYQASDKGLLQYFLFNHLIKSGKPDIDYFINTYTISDKEYSLFVTLAFNKGVKTNKKETEIAKQVLLQEMKALLGRYYFGDEVFFKVLNASDKVIARSMNALQQPDKNLRP